MKKIIFAIFMILIFLGVVVFIKKSKELTLKESFHSSKDVNSSDTAEGTVCPEPKDKNEVTDKRTVVIKHNLVEEKLPEVKVNLNKIERQITLDEWESGRFLRTDPNNWNEEAIRDAIKSVPIEVYTEDVTPEDIAAAKDMMFKYVKCYSSGSYDDWLDTRGGSDALATIEESEYMNKIFQFGLDRWEQDIPDLPKPKTLSEMIKTTWNRAFNYSKGAIDEVSFDMSFFAFYKETKDKFDSRSWEPASDEPHALEKAARERGSLRRGWKGRTFENKVTPKQVMERDGTMKYFDFLATVRKAKGVSLPVMLRYYYDPVSSKWLVAYGTIFLNEVGSGSLGLEPVI